jgi:hypothetical protein
MAGVLVIGAIGLGLIAVFFYQAAKGFDASKEDPQKLFMFYVQKNIPTTVKVIKATGNATPMGGTGIRFQFQIGQKEMEDLISIKHLQKTDALSMHEDLTGMKQPEFYFTDDDTTWSRSRSSVRVIWDRAINKVIYIVLSS